jgi:hypothetical protein
LIVMDVAVVVAVGVHGEGLIGGMAYIARPRHEARRQRSGSPVRQILDYLFKPDYGASAQMLKIEVGGDTNSTSGAGAGPSTASVRSAVVAATAGCSSGRVSSKVPP